MQKLAIKYGLQMFIALVILFVIVHFLGLSTNYQLRVLNGFIHLAFLYLAIRAYRKTHPNSVNNYLSGVAMGTYMTMIAVVLFAVAMISYLSVDQDYFNALKDQFPYPESFTPVTASLGIVLEGLAASVIGAYIVTRVIDSLLSQGK